MSELYARITGWGKYTPARRLTNYDLEQMVDTSDEWISSRTGIRERRIAAPEETTVSMALEASHAALDRAGIRSEDLDLIILATSSPDYLCPAGASILQDRLGANNAGAFDLTAGCTGFVYGLVTATQFIKTGAYRRILVVGAEKLSMAVDWTDRETCVLFGDGAGAVVVEASNSPTGVMAFELGSEGAAWDALVVPGGGSANPMSQGVIDRKENYLRMDGKRVFKFATRTMSRSVQNVVRASGVPFDEVDFIVPHQANARIIETAVKRLKVNPDKVMVNLDRYGNTSAASIPIALSEAVDQGKIQDGNHIVLVGFGAGLTWASVVIHWEPARTAEEESILVADWPVRERLQIQAEKMRAALWSAQVSARTRVEEASMAVMLPFYTWQSNRRKQKNVDLIEPPAEDSPSSE
ncbi:MAG: ketoacyl-ACP synthase III [Anaerolineae bacterium]|nr:ketoacyl-ACP synthase III [Anaerolineae bacterium]MCB0199009.1 ketoacyl-ACP synthase III [Anaerolineae bacterium]MCB0204256.1 ketoacyl-ACP synthase III [Anaerolineae bacterium]